MVSSVIILVFFTLYASSGMVAGGAGELGRLVGRMLARGTSAFEVKLAGPLAYGADAGAEAPGVGEAVRRACAERGAQACRTTLQGMDVALVEVCEGRAS